MEVVSDEGLRQQHRVIAAAEKHVAVAVDQVEIIAQVFDGFFAVDVERYLYTTRRNRHSVSELDFHHQSVLFFSPQLTTDVRAILIYDFDLCILLT